MAKQLKVEGLPDGITEQRLKYFILNKAKVKGGGGTESISIDLRTESGSAIITFLNDDAFSRILSLGKNLTLIDKTITLSPYVDGEGREDKVQDVLSNQSALRSKESNVNESQEEGQFESDTREEDDNENKAAAAQDVYESQEESQSESDASEEDDNENEAAVPQDVLSNQSASRSKESNVNESQEESQSESDASEEDDNKNEAVAQDVLSNQPASRSKESNVNESQEESQSKSDANEEDDNENKAVEIFSRQLKVEGLSSVEENRLRVYFGNKYRGGGPVQSVQLDRKTGTAIITFESSDVVQGLLNNQGVMRLNNATLTLSPLNVSERQKENQSNSDSNEDDDDESKTDDEESFVVIEEPKASGEPVDQSQQNSDEAARDVLSNQTASRLEGGNVNESQEESHSESDANEEDDNESKPAARDVLSNQTASRLVGGNVNESKEESHSYSDANEEDDNESKPAAQNLLINQSAYRLEGGNVNESQEESQSESASREEDDNKSKADTPTRRLKVWKSSADSPIKDTERLKYLFRNKKRKGGGPIERLEFDEGSRSAVITFEDSSAVSLILSKGNSVDFEESTLYFSGLPNDQKKENGSESNVPEDDESQDSESSVVIDEPKPSREPLAQSQQNSDEDEESVECGKGDQSENYLRTKREAWTTKAPKRSSSKDSGKKIRKPIINSNKDQSEDERKGISTTVRADIKDIKRDKEYYELYIEDRVKNFSKKVLILDMEENCIYIRFSCRDDALTLCNDHDDRYFKSVKMASEEELQFYPDMISIRGLDINDKRKLEKFIKKDNKDAKILYEEDAKAAIIRFSTNDLEVIANATWDWIEMEGKQLKTAPVHRCRSICVSWEPPENQDLDHRTLQFYFKNKQRSNGGPCTVEGCPHGARVTFDKEEDRDSVIKKEHHCVMKVDLELTLNFFCRNNSAESQTEDETDYKKGETDVHESEEEENHSVKFAINDVTKPKQLYVEFLKDLNVTFFDEKKMFPDVLDKCIYMTMGSRDANRICQLKQIDLQKYNILTAEMILEEDLPTHYAGAISVHGFGFTAAEMKDKLRSFIFKQTQRQPKDIDHDDESMSAVIHFEKNMKGEEISAEELFDLAWRCIGQMDEGYIVGAPIPICSTIIVTGDCIQTHINNIKDYLSMPDNGGGPVLSHEVIAEDKLLITFKDFEVVDRASEPVSFECHGKRWEYRRFDKCQSPIMYKRFINSLNAEVKNKLSPQNIHPRLNRKISSNKLEGHDIIVLNRTKLKYDCNQQHPTASVNLDAEEKCILIEADNENELKDLEEIIWNYKKNLNCISLEIKPDLKNYLSKPDVQTKINQLLKDKNISASFVNLKIYFCGENSKEANDVIKTAYIKKEMKKPPSPLAISFLNSEKAKKLHEDLEKLDCYLECVPGQKVYMFCFKKDRKTCEKQISDYLLKKVFTEMTIPFSPKKIEFMNNFNFEDRDKIMTSGKKWGAFIDFQDNGIEMKGSKTFLENAEGCWKKLRDQINRQEHNLVFDGVEEYICSGPGQNIMKKIGDECRCLLLPKASDLDQSHNTSMPQPKLVGTLKEGNKKVNIYLGSFLAHPIDVLVSVVSNKTSTMKAVLHNDGDLKKELDAKKTSRDDPGTIIETSNGKLPCKSIFHISLMGAVKDESQMDVLKTALKNCLAKANEKGFKTIMFPLIGIEEFGWLALKAVNCLNHKVMDHLRETTNLEEVCLCTEKEDYALELVKKFGAEQLGDLVPAAKPKSASNVRKFGSINVTMKKGNLLTETCDAIASGIKQTMSLSDSGGVSRNILAKCGDTVQTECDANESNLQQQGAILTNAPNLNCSKIIHVNMSEYSRRWHNGIAKVLEMAEENGFKSIALPAFGAGSKHADHSKIRDSIERGISKFNATNPKVLHDVRFLIADQQLLSFLCEQVSDLPGTSGSSNENVKMNFGSINVTMKSGDLLMENCEVMASGIKKSMSLKDSGAVSRALLNQCGESLQAECTANASDLEQMGAILTSAPNLSCSKIIHVNMGEYSRRWDNGIAKVLEMAEENGLKSIALPAFGAGSKNADPNQIKETIMKGISKFKAKNPKVLHDVRFIIADQRLLNLFSGRGSHSPGSSSDVSGTQLSKKTSIVVYYDNAENGLKAVEKLKEKLKESYTKESFGDVDVLREVTDSQKRSWIMDGVSKQINVIISHTSITLSGFFKDPIFKLKSDILFNVLKKKDNLSCIPTLNSWSYKTEDGWKPFHNKDNIKIETAYNKKEKEVPISDNKGKYYIINFEDMKEYRSSDGHTKDRELCSVKRFDKRTGGYLPGKWEKMGPRDTIKFVELKSGCEEYLKVEKHFKDKGAKGNVKKIERVQNPGLYQQYQAKKTALEKQNPENHENEKRLFHGTDFNTVNLISASGFNRSFCGKNATVYGDGVYFAENSSYSEGYAAADANTNEKKMFQARVLVGESTPSRSGMKTLPLKPGGNIPFDSGSATSNSSPIFIIFHDAQVYPEYVITFS